MRIHAMVRLQNAYHVTQGPRGNMLPAGMLKEEVSMLNEHSSSSCVTLCYVPCLHWCVAHRASQVQDGNSIRCSRRANVLVLE